MESTSGAGTGFDGVLGRDDAKRELQAGAVMQIFDDALKDAKARHPHFPGDLSAMGTILAEEMLEVTKAGMEAMQAINDYRDEGKALDSVITELTHVHAVVERALERLTARMKDTASGRCPTCGTPWTDHLGVEDTCRLHLAAADALVKILAVCDVWGDGGRLHEAIVRLGERGLEYARITRDGEWRLP